MGSRPISRTEHHVPGALPDAWRPGAASHQESGTDVENYHRALEQAHTTALHGHGIAQGLAIRATPGGTTVRISPGTAVDPTGRHIVLAPDGWAETADKPDQNSHLVPITENGVDLPTAGRSGTCLLTTQYRETFDKDLLNNDPPIFLTRHTPWLRLVTTDAEPDPDRVILATLTLDTNGAITPNGLTADGRATPTPLDTTAIHLRATTTTPAPGAATTITETTTAELHARPGGGLGLHLPGSTNPSLTVTPEGNVGIGTTTPQGQLHVAGAAALDTDLTVGGATALGGPLQINGGATLDEELTVGGTATVLGPLNVSSAATLDGWLTVRAGASVSGSLEASGVAAGAWATVGGPRGNGALFVRDASGNSGLQLQSSGRAGTGWFRNANGQDSVVFEGTNGLVWVNGPTNWRRLGGNPTRYVHSVWLFAPSRNVHVADVDLGSPREVFAYVAMTGCDPLDPFEQSDAFALDVFRVDGNLTATWVSGGAHWGPPGDAENVRAQSYRGTAQRITFRARSKESASLIGLGVVFFE